MSKLNHTNYRITKRGKLWYVVDTDGYEVSYVGYETAQEAKASALVRHKEDKEQADVLAYVTEGLGENG